MNVHGQNLLMEPLPPFNKVFSMILQDERQRETSSSVGNSFTDSTAFMLRAPALAPVSRAPAPVSSFNRGGFRTNPNGCRDKPTCSHCGIVGHTIDKCYKIYGFPPGFKFTRLKPPFNPSAHQVQTTKTQPSFPFSQAQCQQLMELMQHNNMPTSKTPSVPQVGPLVHQVGSNLTNDHLFAKISGNHSISFFLNPKHSIFHLVMNLFCLEFLHFLKHKHGSMTLGY